jgi:chemotaxis protein CheC
MNEKSISWHNVGSVSRVEIMVSAALLNAARGLSTLLERDITTGTVQARVVDLADISAGVGHPEDETVGIYLKMHGDLGGQALLILSLEDALNLTDILMEQGPGASTALNEIAQSALAETGHLMVAYFLNAMAVLTGEPLRPSPPAVIVDMLGSILNIIATAVGENSDKLMIIETILQDTQGLFQLRFWVLPDLFSQFQ